jgi:hypothetical protein
MRTRVLSVAAALFFWISAAVAQPVTVIGPITAGDCPQFSSNTVIKDSGFNCNGTPAVSFANPTATAGPTANNGSATTAMRSDASPAVQKGTNSQFGLVQGDGTTISCSTTPGICVALINGIFPTPTRSGDVAVWNGSQWTTLAGNNSGTQVFSENASGVPSWGSVGLGSVTEQKNTASGGLVTSGNCDNTTTNASSPCNYALTTARQTLPTKQVFTSSSGTYTTPANVLWIEIDFVGGGAGGGGGNSASGSTAGGGTCWNTTGAACTSPVYEAGGGGAAANSAGGTGGTISGSSACDWSVPGGIGSSGSSSVASTVAGLGGAGGSSSLGGQGGAVFGSATGSAAATNSGSGGGGGGQSSSTSGEAGAGGGAGATCHVVIGNPAASYTYVVGSGGAGAAGGSNGGTGGAGAAGHIVVYEHYGS